MTRPPRLFSDFDSDFEDEAPEEGDEDDLWFLPGPMEEEEDLPPGAAPLPRASRRALFDMAEWRAAQDRASGELATLAQLYGELDLRLRVGSKGLVQRLALREAADLSWWVGDRISADRLSLWQVLRFGSTDDPDQALPRAGWALRRLSGGPAPAEDLGRFLERASTGEVIVRESAEGEATALGARLSADPGAVEDLADLIAEAADLHPVTQAAVIFSAWRLLGAPQTREMEAAVLAARHAALMARRSGAGASFLPLAQGGPGTFRGEGSPERKFAAWVAGATQSTLAALLHLERLEAWQERARAEIADLSGRTPALLLDCLMRWSHVSTALAETETGASRASCQRNLDLLTARGLIREVTGQGRYRFWTAMI